MTADPVSLLTALGLGPYAAQIASLIAIVGYVVTLIAPFLAPPAQNVGAYATLYGIVNAIARNSGHAANATAPDIVKPVFVPVASVPSTTQGTAS